MRGTFWAGCAAAAGLMGTIVALDAGSTSPMVETEAPTLLQRRLATMKTERVTDWAPPTEHWLGDDDEQFQKTRRKAWMAELHQAGSDVDYKAIELTNGLAQIRKRNALARFPAPPDGAQSDWVERGSDNNAGRMHVAAHSTDGRDLYAGSSRGGVWRRPVDGGIWEPLGDNLYGGAHWLTLYPAADGGSDLILAATDNGQVHWSDDDGATWNVPAGLGTIYGVRRLLQSSDTARTTWMVVQTWNGAWNRRLVRSRDGGRSFETIQELGAFAGDIWAARTGGDPTLWLLADSTLYRSEGDDFVEVATLPRADFNRAELTGSEAGAPRLWTVASGQNGLRELYRFDGEAWVEIDTPDLNPDDNRNDELRDYWGTLNASMVDPDLFAWGGVEVFYTRDGGDSFAKVNNWGAYYQNPAIRLHADNPGMDVVMDGDQEVWYFSTDGGLYESRDGIRSVDNLSLEGLRVSQYYDVLTSSVDPSHVAAGAQDQGYQTTQRYDQTDPDIYDLEQVLSGDYAHLTSSDGSHEVVYSVYPGFMLIALGEGEAQLARADFPRNDNHAWLPPIVADPEDPWSVFFCGERLFRYEYDESQNDWVMEDWSGVSFVEADGEYLSALAFAPSDPDRAYAATNRGRVFHSVDKGKTWTEAPTQVSPPHYFYGHALIVSADDPDLVYLGGNGYETPGVWRSRDGGRTWSDWSDDLPATQVYGLAEARDGSGKVFAATQTSAYARRRDGGEWVDITGNEAPVTTYWSVEALAHENTMRFGTYGRGIWDYRQDPDGDGCVQDQDSDRDGSPCDVDCNDDDPLTFPGAEDVCDGIDRNCDPTDFDEVDNDGDGFPACDDCNDDEATAFPGAEEVRGNDIDEDCDGTVNKGCGCDAGPQGGVWLGLLFPALLLRRRRR